MALELTPERKRASPECAYDRNAQPVRLLFAGQKYCSGQPQGEANRQIPYAGKTMWLADEFYRCLRGTLLTYSDKAYF